MSKPLTWEEVGAIDDDTLTEEEKEELRRNMLAEEGAIIMIDYDDVKVEYDPKLTKKDVYFVVAEEKALWKMQGKVLGFMKIKFDGEDINVYSSGSLPGRHGTKNDVNS